MNIQTLKYEIIEWITQTHDNSLLHTLKSIKDSALKDDNWLENLSEAEKESIQRGLSDHDKGDVVTSSQFWAGHKTNI